MPSNSLMAVMASGAGIRAQAQTLTAVSSPARNGGWLGQILEPFAGAWQRNISVDSPRDVLAFSAVFAAVTIIASDIGKLRVKLMQNDKDGIPEEIQANSPFLAILRKPNHYQNYLQFFIQWFVSKLLWGNSYTLRQREPIRGLAKAFYLLDPQRVTPLVAESGDVYYQLAGDNISGVRESITVPASEIIHDRMVTLWHPLIGISPIYACGHSATMGNKIQRNSTLFFDNMSRPSGVLTAPDTIDDELAARLKTEWEKNFSGNNAGRVAVLGSGLKYEAMVIPAQEAQLIEQLKWTVEDVARCFHVPLYKLGGPAPTYNNVEALNMAYYNDCLQVLIEAAELCLDEGLGLASDKWTEFDLDGLMRMDSVAQIEAYSKAVAGTIMVPNEARRKLNLKPKAGGNSLYLQQQNFSLEALAKRDAKPDPFENSAPKPPALPAPKKDDDAANDERAAEQARALKEIEGRVLAAQRCAQEREEVLRQLVAEMRDEREKIEAAAKEAAEFLDHLAKGFAPCPT